MLSKPKTHSLGDLLKKARDEALTQPEGTSGPDQPVLVVRSIALTPAANATLDRLIAYTAERTGRKTSASAVVRALLRYTEQQDLAAHIATLMEAELHTGEVVWGKMRKQR